MLQLLNVNSEIPYTVGVVITSGVMPNAIFFIISCVSYIRSLQKFFLNKKITLRYVLWIKFYYKLISNMTQLCQQPLLLCKNTPWNGICHFRSQTQKIAKKYKFRVSQHFQQQIYLITSLGTCTTNCKAIRQ